MIRIVVDNVTKMKVDCAVNAANRWLAPGGGVCGAIFAAAGYEKLDRACSAIGGCEVGSAAITDGFDLPAKYIIHAVGADWRENYPEEKKRERLYSCYRRSLELMRENGCSSIAFPLISSGIFGCPKDLAWDIALKACDDYEKENADFEADIYFACLREDVKLFGEERLRLLKSREA